MVNVVGEKQEVGQIQLANFVNPTGLLFKGCNLYMVIEVSGEPIVGVVNQNGFGVIYYNQLEVLNVNIVEEMVNMIFGQCAYEMNLKVIQMGD